MNLVLRPALALPALAVGLTLATSGCTVAGDYRIPKGATTDRSYRSIAGAVQVGPEATINAANTVAGNIEVDDRANTRSLRAVAGAIQIGENARIAGDVSTVAGNIEIGAGTRVSGKVATVAGTVQLNGCRVEGPVQLTAGTLHVRTGTRLPAGIIVKRAHSVDDDDKPQIEIGPGAEVASITVAPKATADLRISREARVGPITGATATYYP